jgi:hypothetical protein
MKPNQWDDFFTLLGIIVHELPGAWEQKMNAVIQATEDREDAVTLGEFVSWNWPENLVDSH